VLPKGSLVIKYKGESSGDGIVFSENSCPSFWEKMQAKGFKHKTLEERHQDTLQNYVASLQKGLETGQVMVFASHGESQLNSDRRKEVNQVMQEKSMSESEKIEALNKLGFGYSGAMDIVENYLPEEWKVK
jgi:hypothetical protein